MTQKRIKLKDTLGALMQSGGVLIQNKSPEDQVRSWADLGRRVILDAFGSGEAELFLSDHGFVALAYQSDYPHVGFIENRRRRLTELIARLDTIQIRLESDPDRIVRVLRAEEFELLQQRAASDQSISAAISSQDQT